MQATVFYNTPVPSYLRRSRLYLRALEKGLRGFSKKNIEVNVIFVDEKEILRVNKQYLNHHYVTDVISFNHVRPPVIVPGEAWAFGDIFVCYPVARQNARVFGHTILQEMLMYVIHGALHLSGMEDHTAQSRAQMDKKAEKIIQEVLK